MGPGGRLLCLLGSTAAMLLTVLERWQPGSLQAVSQQALGLELPISCSRNLWQRIWELDFCAPSLLPPSPQITTVGYGDVLPTTADRPDAHIGFGVIGTFSTAVG